MEWFDRAGLENVPPVFVGTRVAVGRLGERCPSDLPRGSVPTGVVIARVVRLVDYDRYLDVVRARQRGCRPWACASSGSTARSTTATR